MDVQHFAHFVDSLVSWTADSPPYVPPVVTKEDKPALSGFNNRLVLVKRVENRLAKLLAEQERAKEEDYDFDEPIVKPAQTMEEEAEEEPLEEDADD